MEIKPGSKALIRGGIFTVQVRADKPGFWRLDMPTKIIRKSKLVVIEVSESEVIQGMKDYNVEMGVQECSRVESVQKDVARLRFLPRRAT